MQVLPCKAVNDQAFAAVYTTNFCCVKFMQNHTNKSLNRSFGDQQTAGNFLQRVAIQNQMDDMCFSFGK